MTVSASPLRADPSWISPSSFRAVRASRAATSNALLTYGSGETITATLKLRSMAGCLELSHAGYASRSFSLVSDPRHFGGLQWYVVCPKTGRRVRVLYQTTGSHVLCQSSCLGPQGCLCLAVP